MVLTITLITLWYLEKQPGFILSEGSNCSSQLLLLIYREENPLRMNASCSLANRNLRWIQLSGLVDFCLFVQIGR